MPASDHISSRATDFSVRLNESELPLLLTRLEVISRRDVLRMQRFVLRARDYFVYKDMYNPDARERHALLSSGHAGHDAFLLLTKALEAKARRLGRIIPQTPWL